MRISTRWCCRLALPPTALALALAACSSTPPGDNPFAPVQVSAGAAPAEVVSDAFVEVEPIRLSSEDMAKGTVSIATAAGVDVDALPGEPLSPTTPPAAAAPPPAPPSVGLPPQTRWPVRLLSTLPQAQPPRAILGLPNGEEIVVSPGSMLAELGLVVVAVSEGRCDLAQVAPAGDHATITPISLTAQY